MTHDMELYKSKITKDSTEFAKEINEINKKINEINIKIGSKVEEVKEKYISFNSKGIIARKAEEKFLELKKEIKTLNTESDDSINELEKISLRKIEEQKEFQEVIQEEIVKECNETLILLSDESKIPYSVLEPSFTEEDLKNMKDETEKEANEEKSYETGATFKKTHYYSEYSRSKHFEILKSNILERMEKIKKEVINNLIDFVDNIGNKYVDELSKNANEQKQKLNKLLEEKVKTEEIKEKIEKLRYIIQEVNTFKEKIENLRKEIKEYV